MNFVSIFRCYCGLDLEKHDLSVKEVYKNETTHKTEEKWVVNNKYVCEDGLTDAHGEIRFVDNSEHLAKVKHKLRESNFYKKQTFSSSIFVFITKLKLQV